MKIGMLLLAYTGITAGITRLIIETKLFERHHEIIAFLPIPGIIIALPLLFLSAFSKKNHKLDKQRRKVMVIASIVGLMCIFIMIILVILALII